MRSQQKLLLFPRRSSAYSIVPLPVSGIWGWYDASYLPSLFQDTGGASPVTTDAQTVALWHDISGNNHHLTQSTLSNRPVYKATLQNNLSGLQLDGTKLIDSADSLTQTPATVIIAGKRGSTVSVTMGMFSARDSVAGGARVGWNSSNQVNASVTSPSASKTSTATFGADTAFVAGFQSTGSLLYEIANNEFNSVSSTYSGSGSFFGIGRLNTNNTSSLYVGNIYEVLIYASALNSTDVGTLVTYLNSKWALF